MNCPPNVRYQHWQISFNQDSMYKRCMILNKELNVPHTITFVKTFFSLHQLYRRNVTTDFLNKKEHKPDFKPIPILKSQVLGSKKEQYKILGREIRSSINSKI